MEGEGRENLVTCMASGRQSWERQGRWGSRGSRGAGGSSDQLQYFTFCVNPSLATQNTRSGTDTTLQTPSLPAVRHYKMVSRSFTRICLLSDYLCRHRRHAHDQTSRAFPAHIHKLQACNQNWRWQRPGNTPEGEGGKGMMGIGSRVPCSSAPVPAGRW